MIVNKEPNADARDPGRRPKRHRSGCGCTVTNSRDVGRRAPFRRSRGASNDSNPAERRLGDRREWARTRARLRVVHRPQGPTGAVASAASPRRRGPGRGAPGAMAGTRTDLLGHRPCAGPRGTGICRRACGPGCVDRRGGHLCRFVGVARRRRSATPNSPTGAPRRRWWSDRPNSPMWSCSTALTRCGCRASPPVTARAH